MDSTSPSGRVAIRVLRPDLVHNRTGADEEMRQLGVRLGYAVDATVVELVPEREGPCATILNAIAHTHADAVITIGLDHMEAIEHVIRQRAQLITLHGPLIFDRADVQAVTA